MHSAFYNAADDFEQHFSDALLNQSPVLPPGLTTWNGSDPTQRFAVYRNNVMSSLIEALADNFPVVRNQVGSDFFSAMAADYIRHTPPVSPVLAFYGENMPAFLENFPPLRHYPWLGDLARLERQFILSWHAPEPDVAFSPDQIQSDDTTDLYAHLNPSLQLIHSPWAINSLWQCEREDERFQENISSPEYIMLYRPFLEVQIMALSAGEFAFIHALYQGLPLGKAIAIAEVNQPQLDLVSVLHLLAEQRILIALKKASYGTSFMSIIRKYINYYRKATIWGERYTREVIALLARLGLGATFWLSGQSKVEGLEIDILGGIPLKLGWPHITSGAIALFREEYRLPFLSPETAALMAATGEHLFSFFLFLGLATRLSAAGLLVMTLVIEIFVYPDAWPTHAVWATAALFLMAYGAGRLSLDSFIRKHVW